MLKIAQENDLDAVLQFCEGDLSGTKILCYCLAYGFERDFFSCWLNIVGDEIKGVVAKFYDTVTVKIKDSCEAEEIRRFCDMLGYSEILCSESCCEALGFIASKTKKAYVFRGKAGEYTADDLDEEYYKQLYNLISEAIPGSFRADRDSYLSWLSDFTFRKQRGLARSMGISENGILHSCVMTSSETEHSAIISGVACKSTSRKTGLGKKTVLSAVRELECEGKSVYVIALNESAEGFYEHIGFELSERICFISQSERFD